MPNGPKGIEAPIPLIKETGGAAPTPSTTPVPAQGAPASGGGDASSGQVQQTPPTGAEAAPMKNGGLVKRRN